MKEKPDNKKSFIGNLVEKLDMEDGLKDISLSDTQKLKNLSIEPSYLEDRKRLNDSSNQGEKINSGEKSASKEERSILKDDQPKARKVRDESSKTKEEKKVRIKKEKRVKKKENTKKKGKNKFFLSLSLFLLLGLVGFSFFIYQQSKIDRLAFKEEFQKAIASEDLDYLKEVLLYRGQTLRDTEFTAYKKLLFTNTEYQKALLSQLEEVASKEQDEGNLFLLSYPWEGLRKKVKMEIKPAKIINQDGVTVINDEKSSAKEFELLPGTYYVEKNIDFLILRQEKDLYSIDQPSILTFDTKTAEIGNDKITLHSSEDRTRIRSSDTALVFINQYNTGLTVEEFNEQSIRLEEGEIITAVEFLPWTIAFSKRVEYAGENRLDLEIDYANEETKELLTDLVIATLKDDSLAFEQQKPEVLEHVTGEALESAQKWLKSNKEYNLVYLRDYQSIALDYNSFDLQKKGEKYTAYLGGFLDYREAKYSPDYEELPKAEAYRNYEGVRRGFHMVYDEENQEWKTELWGTTYRFLNRNEAQKMKIE